MREDTEKLHFTYEHENNCNYLVLEEKESVANDYQITMLNKNRIEHFLRFDVRLINGISFLYYDISSKQQMTKLFEYGKLTLEDVKLVCRSLSETVRLAKNYMLDLDRILLEPRYMYMDMTDKSLWFIYLPEAELIEFSYGIRRLFEYILEHFDHGSGKQDVVQLYELYQHILVGDYDSENLLLLFHDDAQTDVQSDLQSDAQKVVDSDFQNDNREKPRAESERTFKNPFRSTIPEEGKVKAPEEVEGKRGGSRVINTVLEEVVTEEEEVADPFPNMVVKIVRLIGVAAMTHGLLQIFLPQYALGYMPLLQAVLCVLIGAVIYGLTISFGKQFTYATKFINKKKKIPYVINEADEGENEAEAEVEKRNKMLRKPEPKNSEAGRPEPRTLEPPKSASEPDWNYTVLLSDYIKEEKKTEQLKLTLEQKDIEWNEEEEALAEIVIDHFPFVIGSMKNLVDFSIEKPFISRMHTCIQKKDVSYYIEDLNSTNGTFVNEQRLKGQGQEPLANGDVLRLGLLSYKVEIT